MSITHRIQELVTAFVNGWEQESYKQGLQQSAREDMALRDHLREDQIDKMVKDTFPASDPAALY